MAEIALFAVADPAELWSDLGFVVDDGDTPTAVRLPGWITVVNSPDLVIYRSPD